MLMKLLQVFDVPTLFTTLTVLVFITLTLFCLLMCFSTQNAQTVCRKAAKSCKTGSSRLTHIIY